MAAADDQARQRDPGTVAVEHVRGPNLVQHNLHTPKGSLDANHTLQDIDVIVEEHDSLLHADKTPLPVTVPTYVPWFAWPLLAASLVAVSSAAVVFASMKDVPTFALASWRLQLTTVLLSPAAGYQYFKLSSGAPLSSR